MRAKFFTGSGLILFLLLGSHYAQADEIYGHTLDVVSDIIMIFFALAHVVGAVFIFMSFVYYRRFRQNSVETPISKVLWVLFFGIVLFCFPWVAEQLSIYQTIAQAAQQTTPLPTYYTG